MRCRFALSGGDHAQFKVHAIVGVAKSRLSEAGSVEMARAMADGGRLEKVDIREREGSTQNVYGDEAAARETDMQINAPLRSLHI